MHKNNLLIRKQLYSIICLFRNAVGPEEKFELDRVWITGSLV